MTFIVAIDGGAGSGKGTIARGISKKFNFSYFDTGIIYRGLALKTISKYGQDFTDLNAISEANIFDINSETYLGSKEVLRSMQFKQYSSKALQASVYFSPRILLIPSLILKKYSGYSLRKLLIFLRIEKRIGISLWLKLVKRPRFLLKISSSLRHVLPATS